MRLTAVLRTSDAEQNSGEEVAAVDRRRSARRSLTLSADANVPSAGDTQVLIRDISPGGILIEAEVPALAVDDQIEIYLPDKGVVRTRVAWASGRFFGCEFSEPVSAGAISAALLMAEPQIADREPSRTAASMHPFGEGRRQFEPEVNFSIPLYLSLGVWAVIAAAIYLLVR